MQVFLSPGAADSVPRSERYILLLTQMRSSRTVKAIWSSRAPNWSKRVKAFIDIAIIVIKALIALLELIRAFLK
ncbi:damage-inducible type I toxin DinQ [Photorhabdus laumondii]